MAPFVPSRVREANQAAAEAALARSAPAVPAAGTAQVAALAPAAGAWYFSALCIKLKMEEYVAFGYNLGEDTYVPRVHRERWSPSLEKRFEREPLLAPLPGEQFVLAGDRQQRALLVCSHKKLSDNNIDRQSYEQMLLKVCQKLGDGTLTHPAALPIQLQATTTPHATNRPSAQAQQLSQQQRPITIRSSKGDFLRSAKMHFKADVPVEPYLAFLYQKYGIAPAVPFGIIPLAPYDVSVMQERAEDDTQAFWPILHEPAFKEGHDHGGLGGLRLSVPVLLLAGFSRLPENLQPEDCRGAWWAHGKTPLLVFLPKAGIPSGDSGKASCSNGANTHALSAALASASASLPAAESPPLLSGLSLSDAVLPQSSVVGTSAAAADAAAPTAATVATAVGPAAAAPVATASFLTAGQVYDELTRFHQRFMANNAVSGCSVCMAPCFVRA